MTLVSAWNISFPSNFLGTMVSDEEREIGQKLLEKSCYCVNRGVWINEVCAVPKEEKRKKKKRPLQGSKGKTWFSNSSQEFSFLFLISLPDSRVSQLLMDLLLSHSMVWLPGRTQGCRSWDFKGPSSHTFQLGCSQGFKIKHSTEKMNSSKWRHEGASLGALTEVELFWHKSSMQLQNTSQNHLCT